MHACKCYVCLSHIAIMLCAWVYAYCTCVLGCMLNVHVPMSTYCTAQKQLDTHTQSTGRAPECDISCTCHMYAGAG